MSTTVDIDRAFAEELSELEAFFDRRAGEHEHFRLGRQDPDMRRILEAVAFFAARTRLLATENVRRLVDRVVRGQLDYLLTPVPTAGMLQFQVDGLAARADLPLGTEIRVTAPDRTEGIFTTTRPLSLLPLRLKRVGAQLLGGRCYLVFDLDALIQLRGPLPPLSFLVDYRGSYRDSLRVWSELLAHVGRAQVSFDDDELDAATEAGFSFGAPAAAAGARDDDGLHPVERIRSFFHFPAQDLFFNVTLPAWPKHWSRARIYLKLEGDVPAELLRMSEQVFPLFVVPVANVRRGDSETIFCDGTKDAYPIRDARGPIAGAGREAPTVLSSVVGAYQLDDQRRRPIPPGAISDTGAVYDIVHRGADPDAPSYQIALKIPGAFARPCKVVVDAHWYQPAFDVHAAGKLSASLQTRRVEGTAPSIRGDLVLHRTSPLWSDAVALLHVLSLKTAATLSRDELVMLARYAGADRKSPYRRLPELVQDVRVTVAPENGGRGIIRYVYTLVWKRDDPDWGGLVEDGLVRGFEDRIASLLSAWLADEVELARFDAPPAATARPPAPRLAGARP